MIAVASQRGYQVKELRLAKAVSVYADHERQLSRDLSELATQQSVRYVIVGTLNQSEFYTTVNARLVDIQTNSVVAAASDVIPAEVLGSSEQLQLRQQKLYRTSNR
jgi:TolB-like protein